MSFTGNMLREDFQNVSKLTFIPWEKLQGATIFITGGTGLIGNTIIRVLSLANQEKNLGLKVIALVRDRMRAEQRFADILSGNMIQFLDGSVENIPPIDEKIDYIIHGASQTASKEFVQHAVETIETSVCGTMNLLRIAREKAVKGFVYLSSMEVYGYPERGHKVTENEIGTLIPLDVRNSYPISKVLNESLCCAYASEYQIPAMICRLTQTIGLGVNSGDNRIFSYFGKCIREKTDIVLKTPGKTERSYLNVIDAVSAILLILLCGKPGKAYNAANESTYCSISEMAERIAKDAGIKVKYEIEDESVNGFPKTFYMNMDTSALQELGWFPICSFEG